MSDWDNEDKDTTRKDEIQVKKVDIVTINPGMGDTAASQKKNQVGVSDERSIQIQDQDHSDRPLIMQDGCIDDEKHFSPKSSQDSKHQQHSQDSKIHRIRSKTMSGIQDTYLRAKLDLEQINLTGNENDLLFRQHNFNRMKTSLDSETKYFHQDFQKNKFRTAAQNKEEYMKNYGIKLEIPSIYVKDAKIYPKNPSYYMQLVNISMPSKKEYQYIHVKLNGDLLLSTQRKEQKDSHAEGLVLRLLKKEEFNIKQVAQVVLDTEDALIAFALHGELFAYYSRKYQEIRVFQINQGNLEELITKIQATQKNDEGYLAKFDGKSGTDNDLDFLTTLKFDQNNKYLVGNGTNKVFILNLKTEEKQIHTLNEKKFPKIYDLNFKSSSSNEDDYECYVACQAYNMKQLQIFELKESLDYELENPPSLMTLNFTHAISPHITACISNDFSKVLLGNGEESLILYKVEDQYIQKRLTQTKGRSIRYIKFDEEQNSFYFLLSKEYDKYIYVENTKKTDMDVKFPKSVEPQLVSIYDINFYHQQEQGLETQKVEIKMLSNSDENFCMDEAKYTDIKIPSLNLLYRPSLVEQYNENEDFEQKDIEYYSNSYTPIKAYSTQWPYVTFSGLKNTLYLYNAFDRKYLRCIEIAPEDEEITILQTCITETKDLFIVFQNRDQFMVNMIDLDQSNIKEFKGKQYRIKDRFKTKLILQYSQNDVEGEQLKMMHVRGSSRKELQDSHIKLVILLLHGKKIYSFKQLLNDQETKVKPKFVDTIEGRWKAKDHNLVMYLHNEYDEDDNIASQEIKSINIQYSDYIIKGIFKELNPGEKIQAFNFDREINKLIIQSKQYYVTSSGQKKRFYFRIYDPETCREFFKTRIRNRQLIGRLKGGLYTFVNGHIYFHQNVIKIRYDLLADEQNHDQYEEKELFDFYTDVFHLCENERVRADSPLNAIYSKRFCYIISDKTKTNPNRLYMVPYLHEKKIYLNRIKDHTEYFYTSIETRESDEKKYYQYLYKKMTGRGIEQESDHNKSIALTKQDHDLVAEIYKPISDRQHETKFNSVVCVNLTEGKYYCYSQGGFLLNRVLFQNMEKDYGKIISVSNNGRLFIFKKDWKQLEIMKREGHTKDKLKEEYLTIYLLHLSIFEFQFVKKVNIQKGIKDYFAHHQHTNEKIKEKDVDWILSQDYETVMNTLQLKFVLNNHFDICIRVRNQNDIDDTTKQKVRTFYFYEKFVHGQHRHEIEDDFVDSHLENLLEHSYNDRDDLLLNVYLTDENREDNFTINKSCLFVWTINNVFIHEFQKPITKKTFTRLNISLDPQDHDSYMKDVRTGKNPEYCVIIINQNDQMDTIFIWNIIEDVESGVFEIEKGHEIIWDKTGCPYIITKGKVIFALQRSSSKAFDIDERDFHVEFESNEHDISFHKGYRVDGLNHNWLCIQKYLMLPFSYMTFVIKEKIETEDSVMEDNEFDIVPYNYIFNKSTCFIDGTFIFDDHMQLEKVLSRFSELDPDLLEALHYTNSIYQEGDDPSNTGTKQYSALHKALESGNRRSVDLILSAMAQIPSNSSKSFKDILYQLISYKSFKVYFEQLPIQTVQMSKKLILKINEPISDTIISMGEASTIYVDTKYFREKMGEDIKNPNYSSYPCNIQALRLGWVLNDPDGKQLLQELSVSNDMQLFDIPSVQMIVEFMHTKIKHIIWITSGPLYLLTNILFEWQAVANQEYTADIIDALDENEAHAMCVPGTEARNTEGRSHMMTEVFNSFNDSPSQERLQYVNIVAVMFLGVQIIQIFVTAKYLGTAYLKRGYSLVDLFFVIFNLIFCMMIQAKFVEIDYWTIDQFEEHTKNEKYIMYIGYLFLYSKATYFFGLIDGFASLIDMIFIIVIDLGWFLVITCFYIYAFSRMFYLISWNQVWFDCADEKDIIYTTHSGALYATSAYIYGGMDDGAFELGGNTQSYLLYFIFYFCMLIIQVHFLNMIIAIMAESFTMANEVQDQTKIRKHLKLVIDNWFLLDIAFTNRNKVRYIMTAFFTEEDSNQETMMKELKTNIQTVQSQMLKNFKMVIFYSKNLTQLSTKIMSTLKTYTKPKRKPQFMVTSNKANTKQEKPSKA